MFCVKEDKERKQREAAERKQELQKLYEQEMEASKPKAKTVAPPKLTRVQIQTNKQKMEEGIHHLVLCDNTSSNFCVDFCFMTAGPFNLFQIKFFIICIPWTTGQYFAYVI